MKLTDLPAWSDDVEGAVHVVVETPRGSGIKLRYDPRLRALMHGRALPAGLTYPYDWGFIPSTLADDGDPLDALVITDSPGFPGVVVPARILGVVELTQKKETGRGRERNDRLIAVAQSTERFAELKDAGDLPKALRAELEHFFLDATFFTHKDARITGWKGAAVALALLKKAGKAYRKKK